MDRILLIEDDAGAQLLFRNRLQELGYEVLGASTGARGLMEARAGKFDLFLVDIGLGSGIDGYEVCRRLKAMPQNHGIPVVLISGQVKSQEELHRGYAAGCEAFLVKGDLTLIEDVVRAMLRIKALQNELASQNRLLEERNRRLNEERQRAADLGEALKASGGSGHALLGATHPDAVLLVDADGTVRDTDRGARDILGADIEGKHLATIVSGTGLEAYVRDAKSGVHDSYRFDLQFSNGSIRALTATVMPTVPSSIGAEPGLKVVLLFDAGKQRFASEMRRLGERGVPRREIGPLLEAARHAFRPSQLVGDSSAMRDVRASVTALAALRAPVLVQGEAGVGKELVARILHFHGPASGPFVPVHCSALAPDTLEEELLGRSREGDELPGLLHLAQDGTLFIDEVDRLPEPIQDRLLGILRDGKAPRLGSSQSEPVNVRFVAATSADLDELASKGKLRSELVELLSEHAITLPPLREHLEDVPGLLEHFLHHHDPTGELQLSDEARWVLGEYEWPGNVAEVAECIELTVAHATGPEVGVGDLPTPLFELFKELSDTDAIPSQGAAAGHSHGTVVAAGSPRSPKTKKADRLAEEYLSIDVVEAAPSLEAYERKAILHALRETKGDKLLAAKLLNIGKSTFYRKLKTHGLN